MENANAPLPRSMFLHSVGELARLEEVQKGVDQHLGVHAQVLEVRVADHPADGVGHAPDAELDRGAVPHLLDDKAGDGLVDVGGSQPGQLHQVRALALDHKVHLGDVHAFFAAAQADRKLLVHLHDDRLGLLYHRAGRRVEQREIEVAVLVHGRRRQHADVDFERLAIVTRLVAIEQRDVVDEPLIAEAPVEPAEVPAHERERFVTGVGRHHGERAQRQHPADLDVAQLALARGERPVERLGDTVAEGVLHPIAGADHLDGFLRGPLLGVVLVHGVHREASPSPVAPSGWRPATVVQDIFSHSREKR